MAKSKGFLGFFKNFIDPLGLVHKGGIFNGKINVLDKSKGGIGGAVSGAVGGAVSGSVFGGYGAAVGAAVGLFARKKIKTVESPTADASALAGQFSTTSPSAYRITDANGNAYYINAGA